MEFTISHAERFVDELGTAPKKVKHAFRSVAKPLLTDAPDTSDPPRIKRLTRYKNLWRLRLSDDYRLVYRVDRDHDRDKGEVTLLMLDHRNKVYERLGATDTGEPGVRIIACAEHLLEKAPSPEEVGHALLALDDSQTGSQADAVPDKPLPTPLDPHMLTEWGIPPQHHPALAGATTEGALLALDNSVPREVLERVLNCLFPRRIEDIVQTPIRVAHNLDDLIRSAEGERSLESFLLKLDDDQKAFVSRFEQHNPVGPWLLKGGPGSGKSTVALYCIRALTDGQRRTLPGLDRRLRILFTTYTRSLTKASEHLLSCLGVRDSGHQIDVDNVDRLVSDWLPNDTNLSPKDIDSPEMRELISSALKECRHSVPDFPFNEPHAHYLAEEIDFLIAGHDVASLEEYLRIDRHGRKRQVTEARRQHIWRLYEAYRRLSRQHKIQLFSERIQDAVRLVTPKYDYVFIDEAQDLKPVAIRFCLGLVEDRRNVFLTADVNQSIWGTGLSWSRVANDLSFKGRARILKRNYRTTNEIWQAIQQLTPEETDTDRETLDVETVYSGPWPVFARYSSDRSLGSRLNTFLHGSLLEERLPYSCAVVLCPTNREMTQVANLLDPRFNPKIMASRDVDIAHPGVKVMTMHAAKGLQFPVVAVVGVENGRMPLPSRDEFGQPEHLARQRRLLFVACSRAMRRLIVFGSKHSPSPFTERVTDAQWMIEDLDGHRSS